MLANEDSAERNGKQLEGGRSERGSSREAKRFATDVFCLGFYLRDI
jgi:hypothetical protein